MFLIVVAINTIWRFVVQLAIKVKYKSNANNKTFAA